MPFHGIAIGLRDLGHDHEPAGCHYTLMGSRRWVCVRRAMSRTRRRGRLNGFEADPRVASVTYAGLASSPWK